MPKRKPKQPSTIQKIVQDTLTYFKKLLKIKRDKSDQKAVVATSLQPLKDEHNLLANIDHFDDKTAEDVMVPRSDICAVDSDTSLEELQQVILKHGHTRILVFNENLDNIIGFVHIKDLFEVIANSKNFNLKSLLRKPLSSPHSMKLTDLLKKMQHNRTHIAIVVDEYGGTDGLITIENIIEEIVGRIDDEHDTGNEEEEDFKVIRPGIILANARVGIETIESLTGYQISAEDDEIDTIGGLVMSITGNVPARGEKIELGENISAKIIKSTPRVIKEMEIIYQPIE